MSGRIPQHFIDELVSRADLVELITSRVPLRKAGKEYKACCPFHDEKSPSFTVVPDKQFYHCFGCGAHGTAIGFLMEYDHLSFVEAVEELAARLGLEVPREEDPEARPRPGDELYRVLARTAGFYADELARSERARGYLEGRGIAAATLADFGIGYAPPAWDSVLSQFGRDETARRQLHAAGLIIERESHARSAATGYYDRFRDRIVFPIRDARGRTIGFGGRVLDKGEPKYLNSPETELFHKGRELYGLYEARKSTRSLSRLLVVEGYMDVVRLHQAGITYAVATLGTATTPEHLARLFRVANEVIFCFDGDRAGRSAAWRALENALGLIRDGRQIRFLFLPEGQDPDSLVGAEGRAAFEQRFDGALPLSQYLIRELEARFDTSSVDGRAQLAEAARPLLNRIPAGVYRELLIDELGRVVGMPAARLEAVLSAAGAASPGDARSAGRSSTSARPADAGGAPGTGRRNLVRQAIHLLVHFPGAATAVSDPEVLSCVDRPGIPLLIDLLRTFQSEPLASTGRLLERWRGRPDYQALAKLAARECLVPDLEGARLELREAIRRLIDEEAPGRRLDALLDKGRRSPLSDEEKLELQALLKARGAAHMNRGGERT